MKAFLDSSALAKRYIAEPGSEEVDALCQAADRLGLCVLCVPEIVSALNRRVRERRVSRADYVAVKARLLEDVRDAEIVNLTEDVVADALRILERGAIRAMDALHLAAARAWGADVFASADKAQLRAARLSALKPRRV